MWPVPTETFPGPDVLPADGRCGVVVSVKVVAAFLATELVVAVRSVALRRVTTRRTPPTRVLWRHCRYVNTERFGLVLNVLVQPMKRPLLKLRGVRDTGTNPVQALESDSRTPVFDGFGDEFLMNI